MKIDISKICVTIGDVLESKGSKRTAEKLANEIRNYLKGVSPKERRKALVLAITKDSLDDISDERKEELVDTAISEIIFSFDLEIEDVDNPMYG